ncbi:hypothetical protein J6590_040959 [Homalodisca vitripennis]|nr:hypothetical protein J6590_040959 [Homalodisca vitripennis]
MCGEAPQQVSNSQAPHVRMIAFSNIQSASEVGTDNVQSTKRKCAVKLSTKDDLLAIYRVLSESGMNNVKSTTEEMCGEAPQRLNSQALPHVRMIAFSNIQSAERMIAFSNIQSASESVRIMSVDKREMCGEAPQQLSDSQAPSH